MRNTFPQKHMRPVKSVPVLFAVFLFFIFPRLSDAQMFSVEGKDRDYSIPTAAVYIGLEAVDFNYVGSFGGFQSGVFEFNGPVFRIKLEAPGLTLSLGTGGSITGLENTSYFEGALKANYGVTIVRKKRFSFELPVQLSSTLTSVSNDQIFGQQIEFRQVNIAPGAGLRLSGKPAKRFRIKVEGIPSYGFSTATGGSFGGSIFAFEGSVRLYFDRLFGKIGLSTGYDYNFKKFDISDSLFDYELNSHGFLLGITF